MKKVIQIAAVVLFAFGIIWSTSACGTPQDDSPLRICLDVAEKSGDRPTKGAVEDFLHMAAEKGGIKDVKVEYIPQEGEERQNALSRLRTEIMAKSGPDLFILSTSPMHETIFPYPEKSIINRMFLPLNELMENSQFTQWDSLSSKILAAGQFNGEQYIIPLSYTFPITCYRKADCSDIAPAAVPLDDIMASDDLYLKNAQSLYGIGENKLAGIGGMNFHGILGKLANYENEELSFTEEELARYVKVCLDLSDLDETGEFSSLPDFFQAYAANAFWEKAAGMNQSRPFKGDEPMIMLPQYNRTGGVTATIFNYACVSANSSKGKEAFFLIDLLLSREMQQNSDLMSGLFFNTYGAPLDDALMQKGYSIKNVYDTTLTEENFSAYSTAREHINSVNFYGKLNRYLDNLIEI